MVVLSEVVAGLHVVAGHALPIDPHVLAALACVDLRRLAPEARVPEIVLPDRAFYEDHDQPRQRGLRAAYALAGALVRQRSARLSPQQLHGVVEEILAPDWALIGCELGVVIERLVFTPLEIVEARWTALHIDIAGAVAPASAPASRVVP